jgi:hypothetical protein
MSDGIAYDGARRPDAAKTWQAASYASRSGRFAGPTLLAVGSTLQLTAKVLLLIVVLLVAAGLAQDLYLNFTGQSWDKRIFLLDVDSEDSVLTWLSSAILFLNSFALVLVWRFSRGIEALYWLAFAAGFFLLSMDESVSIHEKISMFIPAHSGEGGSLFLYGWVIPALGVVAVCTLASVPFVRLQPRNVLWLLITAGALYVGGAVGMEILSGQFIGLPDQGSLAYRLFSTVEELLECLGALLLLFTAGVILRMRAAQADRP